MNYGELAQRLMDYPSSSEQTYVDSINDFIIGAENKIYSTVTSPIYWDNEESFSLTADTESFTLPDGVVDILSVRLESSTSDPYLIRKDFEFLRAGYPDSAGRGTPKYYAMTSSQLNSGEPTVSIRVAPIPSSTVTAEVTHRGKANSQSITFGVTSGDTTSTAESFLSVRFPDVLMFGALTYAATFLKMGESGAEYDKRFQEELTFFKNFSESRQANDTFSTEGTQESQL